MSYCRPATGGHHSLSLSLTLTLTLYLLVVGDVAVCQARQQLSEVTPLVALPALPVGLQVGVEAFGPVLAALHL